MTAQEVNARENITSYAAALASGSRPFQTQKVDLPAKTLANGAPEPAAAAHAPSSSDPRLKPPAATVVGGGSTTSTATTSVASRCDDHVGARASSGEEKSNGWEGNSQTSSHKSSGADTARTAESVQPVVNCWTKRQEELAAKPKSSSPPVAVVPPSVSPAPTSASEKGQSPVKKDWGDKTKDSDPTTAKDHKKSPDEGNSFLSLPCARTALTMCSPRQARSSTGPSTTRRRCRRIATSRDGHLLMADSRSRPGRIQEGKGREREGKGKGKVRAPCRTRGQQDLASSANRPALCSASPDQIQSWSPGKPRP